MTNVQSRPEQDTGRKDGLDPEMASVRVGRFFGAYLDAVLGRDKALRTALYNQYLTESLRKQYDKAEKDRSGEDPVLGISLEPVPAGAPAPPLCRVHTERYLGHRSSSSSLSLGDTETVYTTVTMSWGDGPHDSRRLMVVSQPADPMRVDHIQDYQDERALIDIVQRTRRG